MTVDPLFSNDTFLFNQVELNRCAISVPISGRLIWDDSMTWKKFREINDMIIMYMYKWYKCGLHFIPENLPWSYFHESIDDDFEPNWLPDHCQVQDDEPQTLEHTDHTNQSQHKRLEEYFHRLRLDLPH